MPRTYKPKNKGLVASYRRGFLKNMDARSDLTKTLQANYDTIADDLGGPDTLSHIQKTCIERFVFLQAMVNQLEANMANDPSTLTELMGKWTQACNAIVGLAKTLGLEKKILSAPWMNGYVISSDSETKTNKAS